jgi:hypothetical protein
MSDKSDQQLQSRVDQIKLELIKMHDPKGIAARCGMEFCELPEGSRFEFSLFNKPVQIEYPELLAYDHIEGQPLNVALQALICYYMATADGIPLTYRWVTFADLPDGRFYNQAFQGYTGDKLSSFAGNDYAKITSALTLIDGIRMDEGDVAYQFRALPRVPLAIVYWSGDDDFPSSCKILFDSSVSHYLPTDVCAILGSILTHKLLEAVV